MITTEHLFTDPDGDKVILEHLDGATWLTIRPAHPDEHDATVAVPTEMVAALRKAFTQEATS